MHFNYDDPNADTGNDDCRKVLSVEFSYNYFCKLSFEIATLY
nr:unnamed protein product [Callosobruchus analis]